jgi:hypothetical protein
MVTAGAANSSSTSRKRSAEERASGGSRDAGSAACAPVPPARPPDDALRPPAPRAARSNPALGEWIPHIGPEARVHLDNRTARSGAEVRRLHRHTNVTLLRPARYNNTYIIKSIIGRGRTKGRVRGSSATLLNAAIRARRDRGRSTALRAGALARTRTASLPTVETTRYCPFYSLFHYSRFMALFRLDPP